MRDFFPAWHGEQNRVLSPDSTGGLTLFRPQLAPRDTCQDLKGERSPLLPLETRPDSPCESGMQPRVPVTPGEENSVLDTSLDEVYFALQLLESNRQLSLANRIEDWTSLGQYNWKPEFDIVTRESRRNSRKSTWFPHQR